jgi:hypothetical protein
MVFRWLGGAGSWAGPAMLATDRGQPNLACDAAAQEKDGVAVPCLGVGPSTKADARPVQRGASSRIELRSFPESPCLRRLIPDLFPDGGPATDPASARAKPQSGAVAVSQRGSSPAWDPAVGRSTSESHQATLCCDGVEHVGCAPDRVGSLSALLLPLHPACSRPTR